MHETSVLQITEYSLINNSCMSVQTKAQLRLKARTMYYQLLGFLYKKSHACRRNSFLEICTVLQCVRSVSHKVTAGAPKEMYARK